MSEKFSDIEFYRQLAELAYEDTNNIKKFQSKLTQTSPELNDDYHGINEPERFDKILEVIKEYDIDGRNDSICPPYGADVTTFYKDDQLIITYRIVLP